MRTLSAPISLDFLIKITGQKLVLPFYHAVSDEPKPHFSELTYFRTEKDFIADLDFFTQNFESVPIEIANGFSRHFHLSFDDGMREMYDVVFPLLAERKIDATFFVTTGFIDNKKMFVSHKRSLLLNEIKNSSYNSTKAADYLKINENQIFKNVSELKNETEIDQIANLLGIDFKQYLHDHQPYLSKNQIIELKKAGFTIGNHSETHRNFNTLSFSEQKIEIVSTNRFLKALGADKLFFAFPYGDHGIKNEFFEWLFTEGEIEKSFGVSGLKKDFYEKHQHRILMEQPYTAEEIIKTEYFYYFWKAFLYKNKIRR